MTNLTSHPIRNDADHTRVMARIHVLAATDPAPGTPEGDELDVLSLLVRSFEDRLLPISKPTLSEVIEFRADQMGLGTTELDQIFGGRGKRSEVLSGKRQLSKKMAARLQTIGVPDALLLHLLIGSGTTTARGLKKAKRSDSARAKRSHGKKRSAVARH